MNFLRNIISLIMIGTASTALSIQSLLLSKTDCFVYDYYLLAFCLTVFAYNYNKTEKYLVYISYLLLGIAISVSFYFNLYLNLHVILLAVLTSFYFLLPAKYSIRNLTYFKPVFIALIWSLMTVKLPIERSQGELMLVGEIEMILMTLERFFFIFALAIAYDIVDLKHDIVTGLETIPGKHGMAFSMVLVILSLGLGASAAVVSFTFTFYSSAALTALLISFSSSGFILMFIVNRIRFQYQKIFIDSLMIFQFILVYASFQLAQYLSN